MICETDGCKNEALPETNRCVEHIDKHALATLYSWKVKEFDELYAAVKKVTGRK